MWLPELLGSSKTTLRSAGASACENHQAINIAPRWGKISKGLLLHFKLSSGTANDSELFRSHPKLSRVYFIHFCTPCKSSFRSNLLRRFQTSSCHVLLISDPL